jgi:hypothetical protein
MVVCSDSVGYPFNFSLDFDIFPVFDVFGINFVELYKFFIGSFENQNALCRSRVDNVE